jgi:hypothetical protein
MKSLIFFTVFMLLTTNLWSQNTIVVSNSKEYYLQKSNNQKKTGWILLGGGAVLATVGGIGFSENFGIFTDNATGDGYGFMFLTGVISGLSSIPFFISSGNNARRAATITFYLNPSLNANSNSLVQNYQPYLGFKITF